MKGQGTWDLRLEVLLNLICTHYLEYREVQELQCICPVDNTLNKALVQLDEAMP